MVNLIKEINKLYIAKLGRKIISFFSDVGYGFILFLFSIFYLKDFFRKREEILKQMYYAGVHTFVILFLVSTITGAVLALKIGIELKKYGIEPRIGNIVITTLTREMSPLISAFVLIAAVGAAFAAEISSMKQHGEVDALIMMSVSPIKFLVMPRITALAVIFPVLNIYFTFFGVISAGLISISTLGVKWNTYYKFILDGLDFKDLYVGLLKSAVFGILVAVVGCTKGLRAKEGALAVGTATRSTVIVSFLFILIVGALLTTVFY